MTIFGSDTTRIGLSIATITCILWKYRSSGAKDNKKSDVEDDVELISDLSFSRGITQQDDDVSLSSSEENEEDVNSGLSNLGNTCFMNATLQALSSVPYFVQYIKKAAADDESRRKPLIHDIYRIMENLEMNSSTTLDPSSSVAAICNGELQFRGIDQQDAQELLQSIVPKIQQLVTSKMVGKIACDSLQSPLSGWIGSFLQCEICHDSRPTRYTPFFDMMLALPEASCHMPPLRNDWKYWDCTLDECIRTFVSSEIVEGVDCTRCSILNEKKIVMDTLAGLMIVRQTIGNHPASSISIAEDINRYSNRKDELDKMLAAEEDELDCSTLKTILKRTFRKKLQVAGAPPVLCIHIGRKIYSYRKNRMVKLSQRVIFPLELDMQEYCTAGANKFRMGDKEICISSAESTRPAQDPVIYHLKAVIVHHGTARSGHYTTYRCVEFSTGNCWIYVSDEESVQVELSEVLSCEAYILVYSL